jgi:hypothetical protein
VARRLLAFTLRYTSSRAALECALDIMRDFASHGFDAADDDVSDSLPLSDSSSPSSPMASASVAWGLSGGASVNARSRLEAHRPAGAVAGSAPLSFAEAPDSVQWAAFQEVAGFIEGELKSCYASRSQQPDAAEKHSSFVGAPASSTAAGVMCALRRICFTGPTGRGAVRCRLDGGSGDEGSAFAEKCVSRIAQTVSFALKLLSAYTRRASRGSHLVAGTMAEGPERPVEPRLSLLQELRAGARLAARARACFADSPTSVLSSSSRLLPPTVLRQLLFDVDTFLVDASLVIARLGKAPASRKQPELVGPRGVKRRAVAVRAPATEPASGPRMHDADGASDDACKREREALERFLVDEQARFSRRVAAVRSVSAPGGEPAARAASARLPTARRRVPRRSRLRFRSRNRVVDDYLDDLDEEDGDDDFADLEDFLVSDNDDVAFDGADAGAAAQASTAGRGSVSKRSRLF